MQALCDKWYVDSETGLWGEVRESIDADRCLLSVCEAPPGHNYAQVKQLCEYIGTREALERLSFFRSSGAAQEAHANLPAIKEPGQ